MGEDLGECINETRIPSLLIDHLILTSLKTVEIRLNVLQGNEHCKIKAIKEIHEIKGILKMKVHKLKEIMNK